MGKALIKKFDGGQAEDVRTSALDQQETSSNFDIYTNPHYPRPYIDTTLETMSSGATVDFALTDVSAIIVSGVTSFVALGRLSAASSLPTFFRKSSNSDITSTWQLYATGLNTKVAGSLAIFRAYASADLRAYCLGDTGSGYTLQQFDGSATVTTIGTLGGYNASVVAKPFVHPEDNVLYLGAGNIISKYTPTTGALGTDFVGTAFTLPSDKVIVSFSSFGSYLVIVCRPKNGVGNNIAYLWGRDTSLTTLQGTIDLGEGQVNIVENLYNNLFFIMTSSPVGQYSNVMQNRLTVKVYQGGAVDVIKEINLSSTLGTAMNNIKQKVNNTLYFGFSNDTAIYRFGKNKDGSYFLSHDRALPSGATTLNNFSLIGDTFWISYNTAGGSFFFRRSLAASESQSYATVSSYTTTINPGMPEEDRYRVKKFEALSFSFTGGTLNVLKASVDGSAYFNVISNALTGEQTISAFNGDDGLAIEDFVEIQFRIESTGNMKPKEIRYRYEISNTDDI